MLLSNPVVASDGFMYEKASLEQLLMTPNAISPMTREGLKKQFFPAQERKKRALEFRETQSKKLLAFADEAMLAGQQQMAVEAAERVVEYINALPAGSCVSSVTKLQETYLRLGRPAPVLQRTNQTAL